MSYKTYDERGEQEGVSKLVMPGEDARRMMLTNNVCGTCKYFSLREGQRLIEATKFLGTLVRDHRWQTHHLGAPPETLGDCGAARSGSRGDDTTLTGPLHVACDQWRQK